MQVIQCKERFQFIYSSDCHYGNKKFYQKLRVKCAFFCYSTMQNNWKNNQIEVLQSISTEFANLRGISGKVEKTFAWHKSLEAHFY